jgi:thiamine transport system ATP-binding protein
MRLELDGVTVRLGTTVALDGVDLMVDDGEVVCLLGPSGSGKSTLLRVVAGLERPAAGRVLLDGVDVARLAPHERRVGLMFQDYALFPHRDVEGNVAFGLRMAGGHTRDEVRARVAAVLEQVGLAGFQRRAVSRLSGGEQQRVALARALAPAPGLLMLDEPLGSLDRELRDRLVIELRELFAALDTTVIYVTHDQGEAFALGSRVVLLRGGHVVQDGTPEDVWRHPADEATARLLGLTNIVDATVRDGAVELPWGCVRVAGAAAPAHGVARVVIRPDALLPGGGPVAGRVVAQSFRGDHFLVAVATDAGPALDVTVRGDAVPAVGDRIALSIDPDGVVVLSV